jgi:hypothetical protein
VVLNGVSLDPGRVLDRGRVRLDGLAAGNVLEVEAGRAGRLGVRVGRRGDLPAGPGHRRGVAGAG